MRWNGEPRSTMQSLLLCSDLSMRPWLAVVFQPKTTRAFGMLRRQLLGDTDASM